MYYKAILNGAVLILALCFLPGCLPKSGDVIARVNGKKILVSEFEEKIGQMPAYFQQNEGQRRKFLDSLVDRELLVLEAKKRKLFKNKEVKKRFNMALEQILIEELVKNAVPEVVVEQEDLKKYYEERKGQFVEREKVRVRQILVRSEKKARESLKKLKKGADFAKLARTESVSPDANVGGDVGYFGRGEMLPDFEKAAFSLKKGEISEVIKTPFGYHVLKITDKKDKRQKSFAEAKEEIQALLRQKNQGEVLDKWFKELKKKAKIDINDKFLIRAEPDEVIKEDTAVKEETGGDKK